MNGGGRRRHVGLIITALALSACAGGQHKTDENGGEGVNAYPTNYKTDIVAAMRVYLNDPTAIRDATVYEGMREVAAVFVAGRFDQFIETPKELCAGVTYAAFPELEKLSG